MAWETFLEALERGVQAYNSQVGRMTEMCQGTLSFEEAWQQHYSPSRIEQASAEHFLMGSSHKRVVARFDPDNLHSNVYLYDFEGVFLGEAICRKAVSFKDTRAARDKSRLVERVVKSAKRQAKDLELLNHLELAELQKQIEVPQPIEERVQESLIETAIRTTIVQDRNTLRVVEEEVEVGTEEMSEFKQAFMRGIEKTKTLKG